MLASVNGKIYDTDMITAKQIKAARALLGLRQCDLAALCNLSEITIRNIEGDRVDARVSSLGKIQTALEKAGIEFSQGGVHFAANRKATHE